METSFRKWLELVSPSGLSTTTPGGDIPLTAMQTYSQGETGEEIDGDKPPVHHKCRRCNYMKKKMKKR